jgi:4-hydroxybenzoate polyprenyltransferase
LNRGKHILLILHWMNFDTALGAAITSIFIAGNIGSTVPQVVYTALILAVLSIYNFDHLIDARKISGVAKSGRHRFYQQHFTQLAVYQLILLLGLLLVSWFVPMIVAKVGITIAVFTLIYFLMLFLVLPNKFVLKELMIATVFSCAIFLGPLASNLGAISSIEVILLWLEIFLLATANTFLFSWFDYKNDRDEGHSSLAQIVGPERIKSLSYLVLGLLGLLVIISLGYGVAWGGQLVVLGMGMVLLISLEIGQDFSPAENLRIAGEAIFMIPLLAILF